MTIHRAICEDCAWSYEDEDLLEVSDEMDEHARKEMHDVDLQRAVATDGGQHVDDSERSVTTEKCDNCGSENLVGQVICAVCGGEVRDV